MKTQWILTCLVVKKYCTVLKTNKNIDILFKCFDDLPECPNVETALSKPDYIIYLSDLFLHKHLVVEVMR